MNVCLTCEASVSHIHVHCGKFGLRVYNVSRISLLAKKKMAEKRKKAHHRSDFEAYQLQKPETYFVPYADDTNILCCKKDLPIQRR